MKRFMLVSLLLLVGCTPPSVWVQDKGRLPVTKLNVSVVIPTGWMRLNNENYLLLTRDGTLLQSISVNRKAVNSPFQYTKKKLAKGMLPHEVADVIVDNMSSNQATQNFILQENTPATIAGEPGFKLVYGYRNRDGVKQKAIFYGFLFNEWFYEIRYHAAERYYFQKDIKAFEQFMAEFGKQ